MLTLSACKEQYVGSMIKFKERFRVHKSYITTGKDRCGVAKNFIWKSSDNNKLVNFKVQLIKHIGYDNDNIDSNLWSREKYFQAKLFLT